MTFPDLKSQAEIDAEEDRRAAIENAWELFNCAVGLVCLIALVFAPMMWGAV